MGTAIDELAPIDWVVVEFPGSRFTGEIAPALAEIVDRGVIRVLDLLLLRKGADGSFDAYELSDLDDSEVGELRAYAGQLATVLSEEDVARAAAAVEPGTTAALLVWENTWAAPFVSGVRRSGGQLVAAAASWRRRCWTRSRKLRTRKERHNAFGSEKGPPNRCDRTGAGGSNSHHRRYRCGGRAWGGPAR